MNIIKYINNTIIEGKGAHHWGGQLPIVGCKVARYQGVLCPLYGGQVPNVKEGISVVSEF